MFNIINPRPRRSLRWLCLAPLFFLSCVHGKPYQPVESYPPDQALVYFYRPEAHGTKGGKYSIKWVETELGKLRYGSYFTYLAAPGSYTFYHESHFGFAKIEVNLLAGETYYIRFRARGLLGGKLIFELVPSSFAQVELMDCRYYP